MFTMFRNTSMEGSKMPFFIATRKSLAKSCGVSVQSVDKYLDILQKNKIIYIHKLNSNKQFPNIYACGLYEDKDKIDGYFSNVKDDTISKSK